MRGKKVLVFTVILAMMLEMLALPGFAVEEEADAFDEPTEYAEYVNPDVETELSEETEPKVELFARTVTSIVSCYRTIDITASATNKFFLYDEPTDTSYGSDNYRDNYTLHSYKYYILSDGTVRYEIIAGNSEDNSDATYAYYLELGTRAKINTIYHTYGSAESAHPHYKTCGCGALKTSTNSSCLTCYPATISYSANGGSGAPSSQTVTASPTTLSTTIPTRFPYTFAGWSTSSSSSYASYVAGESYSISAGASKTFYAVWKSPAALSTTTSVTSSYNITNKGGYAYFSFTPSETASYSFEATSTGDTYGYLYDADGNQIAFNDDADGANNRNFRIIQKLTEGVTYYYKIKWYSSSTTGSIPVLLRRQYDVTFDANGGEGAPDAQKKLHGEAITLTNTEPVKDSFTFAGWADTSDAELAQYSAGGTYDAEGDKTLYAVWTYPSGSCGESAVWTYKDNTLYISGSGDMNDYTAANEVPWYSFAGQIQSIQIDEGITSIGSYAFSDCALVTEIVLPDSIAAIGQHAFNNCTALESIAVPEGVLSIEDNTFYNCSGLKTVSLPSSLTEVGDYAFFGCSGIQEMILPSDVTGLGEYAFANCVSLSAIHIPNGVTTIPTRVFSGCSSLNEIVIPGAVTVIGEYAFEGCAALTEVIIPSSVTQIDRAAFANCTALGYVTIPDSVTTIGTSIFAYVTDRVTVRCYLDTPIYQYAIDNDIAYELMNWGKLEAPSFVRKAIAEGVTIQISAPKGDIYYTIDGTEPTEESILYEGLITAHSNFTIKAIAVCEGWETSEVAVFDTAIPKVETPSANILNGSRVPAGTVVELSCATEGATILCTTNGDLPTEADLYEGPITINQATTIYAYAVKEGMLKSSLAYFTYEITDSEDVPVVTTLEATDVTETTAKVSAEVNADDENVYVEFVYYEKNNSSLRYTAETDENYCAVLTGLTPGTEYWFQARAKNDLGWSSGYICTFMTEAADVTKPASVTVDPAYLALNVGQSKTILATVLPITADNREVYWKSENESIATVSADGVVTAVGIGDTRIQATTVSNRLVAYCNIKVIHSTVDGTFDFSELNMITNSSYYDEHGFDHGPEAGGNALMASAYLARWDGAVLEVNDPYPGSLAGVQYQDVESDYHVQNILYLPYRNVDAKNHAMDTEEIKSAVMKYGAVYTAFKVNYDYFSDNQKNYYLPENVRSYDGGHAVAIVGWDDDYPRTAFTEIAPGDGAFICKNSWGEDSGEDGYFYVSYYDQYIARPTCGDFNAVFYDLESKDNYNKIYQYDYLGPVATQTLISKEAYISNVFPESGSALTENETLEAVSFYNYSPGTAYEVYVVEDYENKNSLKSLGDPVKTGVLEYAGYFTVELNEEIELEEGTRFAVVVKYIPTTGNTTIFVEVPTTIRSGSSEIKHSYNARANADESYVSNNGKQWIDYTAQLANANVCVKAFTKTTNNTLLLQGIDNVNREYEDDTVHTMDELIEKGYGFNPALTEETGVSLLSDEEDEGSFGFMAPTIIPDLNTNNNYSEGAALPRSYDLRKEGCMTPVKNQGNIGSCWSFATYASLESALKKASASATSLSADGLNQSSGTAATIDLSQNGMVVALGTTQQIVATVYPYDSDASILWRSSNQNVASVSAHGVVTTLGVGNAIITASTADGTCVAECYVTVTEASAVRAITIDNTETTLSVGKTLLMEYSCLPSTAEEPVLVWETSDAAIATIDAYGLLTAKNNGTVTVTVSTQDGTLSASYTITIEGGKAVFAEVAEERFVIADSVLSGSMSLTIGNSGAEELPCYVLAAFYTEDGKILKVYEQTARLQSGVNQIEFTDLNVTGIKTDSVVKVFVLNSISDLVPLTEALRWKIS